MRKTFIAATALAFGLSAAAAPVLAQSQPRRVLVCHKSKKHANTGTAVGAVLGGVLGSQVAGHGARTEGTVLGAGVGAVAGHQLAKKKTCRWVYR